MGATVGVRDSKTPSAAVLSFDPKEWRSFLTAARGGRYDLS